MILQIDRRLPVEIRTFGCHYMAELFILNRRTNIELDAGIIVDAFMKLKAQQASWQKDPLHPVTVIGANAEINNPDDIVMFFGQRYLEAARMVSAAYECSEGEQELLKWERPGWTHWTAGDGKGNVTYDPEGYSVTVAQGKLVAKKIFTIIPEAT